MNLCFKKVSNEKKSFDFMHPFIPLFQSPFTMYRQRNTDSHKHLLWASGYWAISCLITCWIELESNVSHLFNGLNLAFSSFIYYCNHHSSLVWFIEYFHGNRLFAHIILMMIERKGVKIVIPTIAVAFSNKALPIYNGSLRTIWKI